MKKIFTLFVALFAMTIFANAQNLLQEGFETGAVPTGWTVLDADGDTYSWEGSASPVSYFVEGTDLSGSGHNASQGFVLSGSYSNVTQSALTPDNWLITPAVTLTGDATLKFWVCAQDASYAAEHYGVYISTTGTAVANFNLLFEETIDANGGSRAQGAWKQKTYNLASYTGQTVYIAFRHFNCSDEFVFNLDDVEISANPTGPTIIAQQTSVEFGSVMVGNSVEGQVSIVAYNLTAGITASTTAPFAVSSTGSNFGNTATISQDGGLLYIQYTPTAVGNDNGIVSLSSGSASANITLTGAGFSCESVTVPYANDFMDEALNQCWTVVDANNDGDPSTGSGLFHVVEGGALYVYSSTNNADDWLISPAIQVGPNCMATFDYWCRLSSYPERFSVYVIPAGQTYQTATQVVAPVDVTNDEATMTQEVDLSAYANQTIQVAIHCESDADEYYFYVTNFFIDSDPVGIEEVESNNISVYPNPANNYVNVNANSNISNVEVYTISGQKVADFTANGTQAVISTSNLSNGMYLMRINTENGTINKKFSVAR
jgi:hypothetical protein